MLCCNVFTSSLESPGIHSTPPPIGDWVAGWEWALGPEFVQSDGEGEGEGEATPAVRDRALSLNQNWAYMTLAKHTVQNKPGPVAFWVLETPGLIPASNPKEEKLARNFFQRISVQIVSPGEKFGTVDEEEERAQRTWTLSAGKNWRSSNSPQVNMMGVYFVEAERRAKAV
eukprot:g79509.t1